MGITTLTQSRTHSLAIHQEVAYPRIYMRLRGAGYILFSSLPTDINPNLFRHIFFAYSPSGICPLPLKVWLGFP